MVELFGIVKISNMFVTIGTVDLALLIAYIFGRYTGNYPEFVGIIDKYAEEFWLFVSERVCGLLFRRIRTTRQPKAKCLRVITKRNLPN